MSRTLLVIQSYADHKYLVDMLWEHYRLPGWPILGVVPEDSVHSWPPSIKHCLMMGRAGYMQPGVINRWVATWTLLANHESYSEYDSFCIVESDSFFLRQPPPHPGGLFTHQAVGHIGGASKASRGFHCPWWADRATAKIIAEEGAKLITAGELELCSPDMFLGLITDRRPEIVVHETGTWSCNGNDLQNRRDQAEKSIRAGCWFMHGLRTQEEFDWLKSLVQ